MAPLKLGRDPAREMAAPIRLGPAVTNIREATDSDNEGLLKLTSTVPMNGEISIRTDRHPDFFALLKRRGNPTVFVAESQGKIVGSISAADVQAYVNGKPRVVSYVGDLKVHPAFQRTGLAVRLAKTLHGRLSERGRDILICTAAFGNEQVMPFFSGKAGLPRFSRIGLFRVFQIIPFRSRGTTGPCSVREVPAGPDLYRCYDEYFQRYEFRPVFKPESLEDARNWVARSGGLVRAALSVVDVGNSKQNVLIKLPFWLKILVVLLHPLEQIVPFVRLPKMNEPIKILYIKALGFQRGYEKALDQLIRQARNVAFEQKYHFLAVGVHEKDPLGKRVAKYPKFTFKSVGLATSLENREDEIRRLAKGISYEDYSLV